jgi:zinc protease
MEERRLRTEDDPQSFVFEEVMAAAFKNHPYRWPVIGWMSDLRTLNPDDLIDHYRMYYAPNNAVIIVVGDVDQKQIMEKISASFGSIPAGPPIPAAASGEDEQKGERRVYVKKEAELPYIMTAYKVPNISHKDGFALDVLGSILSDGKSSRLYHALVYEQQIALSAWASYEGLRLPCRRNRCAGQKDRGC